MMGTLLLREFRKKERREEGRKRKNFVRCPRRGIGGLSERESRNQGEDNSMFMVIQAHHEQNFLQSSRYAIHAYHYLRISSFPTVPSGRIIGPCHLKKSSTFPLLLLLLHLHAALPFDVAKRRNGKRREKKNHGEKDDRVVRYTREERAFLD